MVVLRLDGADWEFQDQRIAALIATIMDLRPFWPRIVPLFVRWMGEQFETEGAWAAQPWARLSPMYEAWKQRHYPGRGILVVRGGRAPGLRFAAQSPNTTFRPQEAIFRIQGWRSGDGDLLDPGWHQEGTDRMPARPIIPDVLPQAASDDVSQAAESYIEENVRALGLD